MGEGGDKREGLLIDLDGVIYQSGQIIDGALLTHDVIIVRTHAWRRVFDVPDGVATDLVVHVPNAAEAAA